jgi:hypothetical protein
LRDDPDIAGQSRKVPGEVQKISRNPAHSTNSPSRGNNNIFAPDYVPDEVLEQLPVGSMTLAEAFSACDVVREWPFPLHK